MQDFDSFIDGLNNVELEELAKEYRLNIETVLPHKDKLEYRSVCSRQGVHSLASVGYLLDLFESCGFECMVKSGIGIDTGFDLLASRDGRTPLNIEVLTPGGQILRDLEFLEEGVCNVGSVSKERDGVVDWFVYKIQEKSQQREIEDPYVIAVDMKNQMVWGNRVLEAVEERVQGLEDSSLDGLLLFQSAFNVDGDKCVYEVWESEEGDALQFLREALPVSRALSDPVQDDRVLEVVGDDFGKAQFRVTDGNGIRFGFCSELETAFEILENIQASVSESVRPGQVRVDLVGQSSGSAIFEEMEELEEPIREYLNYALS